MATDSVLPQEEANWLKTEGMHPTGGTRRPQPQPQPDRDTLRKWVLTCMLRLQSQREHSRQELLDKTAARLRRRGWSADEALLTDVLNTLKAKNWVCDARAAESVVNSRQQRWGVRRIQQALQQKGLPDAVVEEAVQELAASEYDRAVTVWQKKYAGKAMDTSDARVYARQVRFLAGRGFGADVVRKVVRRMNHPAE